MEILDTTVVIDYLRGKEQATIYIENLPQPTISTISLAELYKGAKKNWKLKL